MTVENNEGAKVDESSPVGVERVGQGSVKTRSKNGP